MGRLVSTEDKDLGTIGWQKAVKLMRDSRVEMESYNDNTDKIMFTVRGESDVYSVTMTASEKIGNCTCQWASNHDLDKMCSHELACHLYLMIRNTEYTMIHEDKLDKLTEFDRNGNQE